MLDELDSFVDSEPQGWSPLRAAKDRQRSERPTEEPLPEERREPAFAKSRRPIGANALAAASAQSGGSERVDAFTRRLDEQLARPPGEALPAATPQPLSGQVPPAPPMDGPLPAGEPDVVPPAPTVPPASVVPAAAADHSSATEPEQPPQTVSRRIPPAPPVETLSVEHPSEKVDALPDIDLSDDEPADALDWELNHAIGAIVSGQATAKEPEPAEPPAPQAAATAPALKSAPAGAPRPAVMTTPVVSERKPKSVPVFNFERRDELADPVIPTDTEELIDTLYFPDARSALDTARPMPDGEGITSELDTEPAEFVYDDVEPARAEFDEHAANGRRRQRGGMRSAGIAAVVACLAVVGVAGVIGFNVFAGGSGGGDDGPPVIRADAQDVKVRVDNSTPQAEPDIMQRTAVRDNGRLVQETVTIPAAREAFPDDADDALTRRRVQTVVVRPDGTLVPAASAVRDAVARRTPTPESLGVPNVRAVEPPVSDTVAQPLDEPVRVAAVNPAATIGPESTRDAVSAPEPTPIVETPFNGDLGPSSARPVDPAAIGIPRKRPADVPVIRSNPTPSSSGPVDLASQRSTAPAVSTPATEPAPVQSGLSPWAVQVSSQRSRADAERSFRNLQQRYSSILGDVDPLILQANVPGRGVFYRVRIASASRSEAAGLCQRLKAAGADCFIGRN